MVADATPTETTTEQRREEFLLRREYFEKFGEGYPCGPGMKDLPYAEYIADMRRRIAEGVPRPRPAYREDCLY